MENVCECALDYDNQLKYFKSGVNAFSNNCYSNKITFENNKYILENELNNFIDPI